MYRIRAFKNLLRVSVIVMLSGEGIVNIECSIQKFVYKIAFWGMWYTIQYL